MSVFLINQDQEDADSPAAIGGIQNVQGMSEASQALLQFWPKVTDEIRKIGQMDMRSQSLPQALPLARIKKIMKLDEDVKMISAEAPVLFAKAAELFIHELTLRAWLHTEDNKRRTLQRNDIAMAITKYDQFDFLIDIVPRDEVKPPTHTTRATGGGSTTQQHDTRAAINADQVHYYFQLAQQHQAAMQGGGAGAQSANAQQAAAQQPQQSQQQTIQVIQPQQIQALSVQHPDVSLIKANTNAAANSTGGIQLVQQVVTPAGEVQQVPIHLTPSQMQMIRMQLQSNSGQPIIIQTAPIQQPHVIQVTQQNAAPVYIQSTGGTTGVATSESE